MNEELRQRLARIDPMPSGVPVAGSNDESSRQMMEDIMSTQLEDQKETPSRAMRWLPVAAVAALVLGLSGALLLRDGEPTSVALNAGGEDIFASCIQFSTEELARAPLAFEGTVVAVNGTDVTLDVVTWFKGGDSDQVVLNGPQGLEALIGGIPFETGESYLITAYDGNVNYCGFSGVATPEFRAAFEEAFGA